MHGAITSMTAAICLQSCNIRELHKFGILMVVTLTAAVFFSLVFYPAISF